MEELRDFILKILLPVALRSSEELAKLLVITFQKIRASLLFSLRSC